MTEQPPTAKPGPGDRIGRYRPHTQPARTERLQLRYTKAEYTAVAQAAHNAGLTTTGYAADAALATALDLEPPTAEPWRTVLTELIEARTQVRKIGTNINQAARALNATGDPPPGSNTPSTPLTTPSPASTTQRPPSQPKPARTTPRHATQITRTRS